MADKIRLVFRCGLEEWTFDVRLPTRNETFALMASFDPTAPRPLTLPNGIPTRTGFLILEGGELPPPEFLSVMDQASLLNYLDAAEERLFDGESRFLAHEFIPLGKDPLTAWGRLVDLDYDVLES